MRTLMADPPEHTKSAINRICSTDDAIAGRRPSRVLANIDRCHSHVGYPTSSTQAPFYETLF